jgi:hypothetical protein
VVIISVLPLAQYFFGIWGLILATPVAVYVIYEVILRRGLPGVEGPDKPQHSLKGEPGDGPPSDLKVTTRDGSTAGATTPVGCARLVTPAAE